VEKRNSQRLVTVLLLFGIIALLVSIVVPVLNRYRETAGRDPCASNLRQLGQALLLYQMDHKGLWPQRIEEATAPLDVPPVVLTCIVAEKPFVFLRGGAVASTLGENDVVAYEPAEYHDGRGGCALFGDGHVMWLTPEELKAAIARPVSTTRAVATTTTTAP
jgi:hypothetical protein